MLDGTADDMRAANKPLPFALPDIGAEELAEVADSLRSGWLTTGPKTKRFEKEFGDLLGGDVATIAVNSATAGLHLALEALDIGPGDQVITTPYTFTATAEVVRYLGADPVFADIDARTLNIDPAAVEAAITPRTKAILPVHLGGLAADMHRIHALAGARGVSVVEDAAHALPTTCRGALIGTLGSDATVFSFYATKTLATGEGGMLATRRADVAARARVMRLHGIDRDAFDRYVSDRPGWYYEVVAPGFKYNLTDVAASLGLVQLRKVRTFQCRRQHMAERYHEAFADLPVQLPASAPDGDLHSWHLYIIRLRDDAPLSRNAFIEAMANRGVGTSVHYIPLHLHPYWRETYSLRPEDFPRALAAYERAVSLPIYTRMSEADQERVISAVREILGA